MNQDKNLFEWLDECMCVPDYLNLCKDDLYTLSIMKERNINPVSYNEAIKQGDSRFTDYRVTTFQGIDNIIVNNATLGNLGKTSYDEKSYLVVDEDEVLDALNALDDAGIMCDGPYSDAKELYEVETAYNTIQKLDYEKELNMNNIKKAKLLSEVLKETNIDNMENYIWNKILEV